MEGVYWCLSGVGRSENLATEALPREIILLSLDGEVVDGEARRRELVPHGHEETVGAVDRLLTVDEATLEAAAELDELLGLLTETPLGIHLIWGDTEPTL